MVSRIRFSLSIMLETGQIWYILSYHPIARVLSTLEACRSHPEYFGAQQLHPWTNSSGSLTVISPETKIFLPSSVMCEYGEFVSSGHTCLLCCLQTAPEHPLGMMTKQPRRMASWYWRRAFDSKRSHRYRGSHNPICVCRDSCLRESGNDGMARSLSGSSPESGGLYGSLPRLRCELQPGKHGFTSEWWDQTSR